MNRSSLPWARKKLFIFFSSDPNTDARTRELPIDGGPPASGSSREATSSLAPKLAVCQGSSRKDVCFCRGPPHKGWFSFLAPL